LRLLNVTILQRRLINLLALRRVGHEQDFWVAAFNYPQVREVGQNNSAFP